MLIALLVHWRQVLQNTTLGVVSDGTIREAWGLTEEDFATSDKNMAIVGREGELPFLVVEGEEAALSNLSDTTAALSNLGHLLIPHHREVWALRACVEVIVDDDWDLILKIEQVVGCLRHRSRNAIHDEKLVSIFVSLIIDKADDARFLCQGRHISYGDLVHICSDLLGIHRGKLLRDFLAFV